KGVIDRRTVSACDAEDTAEGRFTTCTPTSRYINRKAGTTTQNLQRRSGILRYTLAIMRSSILSPFVSLLSFLSLLSGVSAIRLIESKSLNTCQANSSFTASLFNVVFTPENKTITYDIVGVSSVQGNVSFEIEVSAYGYVFITETINPCDVKDMSGLCPMATGQLDINSNLQFSQDVIDQIPAIAYGVPDLDANVKVHINTTASPSTQVACVEANLSNGKTVDQKGVGWTTAVIAGLALVASAVTSGLGHSNTAAHVAANALSLFGYFQAQAIVGLTAVSLPPIVQSWTQNFDWSMGIIQVNFMQSIATWYQKSTGGTPATLLNTLTTTSVQVEKRSVGIGIAKRTADETIQLLTHAHNLHKRTNNAAATTSGTYVVRGIDRVAFRAGMESTNLFLTGLAFFCIFIVFTIIFVALFKGFCELAVRMRWMKTDKFQDFRNGWFTVLKGIMFRMVLIGYPQMTILCLWEFTQVDSPAEVVLAIFFFFGMTGTLAWAAMKVIRIAKRSVAMHKNPAYILYSDPAALNKWGFLYVQFRATAYYYILPVLVYVLVKGMFIAFGQNSGTVQAIALVIIEAAALIAASVVRPWMDKSTNVFNIAICAVNFLNAIFLLVFTDVFNQPGLVTGVMGVIFFIVNAAFSLVLIILVLVGTAYAFIKKNPDTRYQPMGDDRASFIKSQTQLTTELDALGATARGDKAGYKHNLDLDDDNESWSSDSLRNPANMPLPPSTANSGAHYREPPHSPVDPSMPLFPAGGRGAPPNYQDDPRQAYQHGAESRPNSDLPLINNNRGAAPAPYRDNSPASHLSGGYRSQNNTSPAGFRNQNNASPWQRGAGYDH
ncbi:Flavin carrier protein, partial [Lachnellula suecica]